MPLQHPALNQVKQLSGVVLSTSESQCFQCSAVEADLPRIARFLPDAMYGDLPKVQRNDLAQLQLVDLKTRYGSKVGKRVYPSPLLLAVEGDEVVG